MHNRAAYDLSVGLALRELHEEHKVLRERVAAALEVSELAVTRFETGEEKVSAGTLILILKLFNLSWEEFLARVERQLPKAEGEILK